MEFFNNLVTIVGLSNALYGIILLSCHFYIFRLYKDRLNDRQEEINRIAEENHKYRDIFIDMLDKNFNNK